MSNHDRKDAGLDPDEAKAAADAGGREANPAAVPDQTTPETIPSDDPVAPFTP